MSCCVFARMCLLEQDCIYQDMDYDDQPAIHLWLTDEEDRIVALCRVCPAGTHMEEHFEDNTKKESELNEPPTATKFNVTLKALVALLALLIICYGIIQYRINLYKK